MIWRTFGLVLCIAGWLNLPSAEAQVYGRDDPYCTGFEGAEATLLLIDVTSGFDEEDRGRLAAGFEALAGQLRSGDLLVIKTITNLGAASLRVFDGCMPGCPPRTLLSGFCDRQEARQKAIAFVREGAFRVANDIINQPIRSFQSTAIAQTLLFAGREGRWNNVIIFSDFLEYSGPDSDYEISFYNPEKEETDAYIDYLQETDQIPNMPGTVVKGFGLFKSLNNDARNPILPDSWAIIAAFWTEYFARAGVGSVEITQDLRF